MLVKQRIFLGLELAHSEKSMYITQQKYVLDILTDTGLTGSRPALTPLPKNFKFYTESDPFPNPKQYRRLIDRLLYLNFTKSDISYTVNRLSQFTESPTCIQWDAALHVCNWFVLSILN